MNLIHNIYKSMKSTQKVLLTISNFLLKYCPSVAKKSSDFITTSSKKPQSKIKKYHEDSTPKEIHIHYSYYDYRAHENSEQIPERNSDTESQNFFEGESSGEKSNSYKNQTDDYGFSLEDVFDLKPSKTPTSSKKSKNNDYFQMDFGENQK